MQTDALTDYERQRGKPAPDFLHSLAQTNLMFGLHAGVGDQYMVTPELDLQLADGTVVTPDISVLSKRAIRWGGEPRYSNEVPLLVAEVLLIGQSGADILPKLSLYFAHGVQSVWEVNPALKYIAIHRPGEKEARVIQHGEASDPATGLTVRLEEVFS